MKPLLVAVISLLLPQAMMGSEFTQVQKIVIERVNGDSSLPGIGGDYQPTYAPKTAIKLGRVYPLTVDVRFVHSATNAYFYFADYGSSCVTTVNSPAMGNYKEGDHARVDCIYKSQKIGPNTLLIGLNESRPDGLIVGFPNQVYLPIVVRPAMTWHSIVGFEGLRMAVREGALALLLGALAFAVLLRKRGRYSWSRIFYWVPLLSVVALGLQIIVWYLMDKAFASMPESLFTVFNALNFPALLALLVLIPAAWMLVQPSNHSDI